MKTNTKTTEANDFLEWWNESSTVKQPVRNEDKAVNLELEILVYNQSLGLK